MMANHGRVTDTSVKYVVSLPVNLHAASNPGLLSCLLLFGFAFANASFCHVA